MKIAFTLGGVEVTVIDTSLEELEDLEREEAEAEAKEARWRALLDLSQEGDGLSPGQMAEYRKLTEELIP